jgi:hypothetical protein
MLMECLVDHAHIRIRTRSYITITLTIIMKNMKVTKNSFLFQVIAKIVHAPVILDITTILVMRGKLNLL